MLIGATSTELFLSEHGNDKSDCKEPPAACRTLRRALDVADAGRAVIYVDSAPRSTSGWLCREETVLQVRGSITIKPGPPTTSETATLGCGADHSVRRALTFNVTGTRRRSWTSLTLERLVVEGVILLVRDAHVTVVQSTLVDVSLIEADNNTDHVGVDVINSTWTVSSNQNDPTTCKVGESTGGSTRHWRRGAPPPSLTKM